jgi:hypothetical protein
MSDYFHQNNRTRDLINTNQDWQQFIGRVLWQTCENVHESLAFEVEILRQLSEYKLLKV